MVGGLLVEEKHFYQCLDCESRVVSKEAMSKVGTIAIGQSQRERALGSSALPNPRMSSIVRPVGHNARFPL